MSLRPSLRGVGVVRGGGGAGWGWCGWSEGLSVEARLYPITVLPGAVYGVWKESTKEILKMVTSSQMLVGKK
jgi:hypothetical protein